MTGRVRHGGALRTRGGLFKNVLAAVGAVFIIITVLSALLSLIFGGGGLTGADKVAVVKLEGLITDPADVTGELRAYGERDDVKAVVLRIESPGGAVGPSQEIHREILRLRESKPVVASLGAVAASGGYYAAAAADKIVASPGTITGSIGVIVEFVNAEGLLDKLGLKGYVVKSGRYKDTGSPLRKMEDDERELLQGVIDEVNSQFISAVAEGRGMAEKEVRPIADGRILTGSQALDLGLIDAIGDLTDAVDIVAGLAGIEGKPSVIYPKRRAFTFWDVLFGGSGARGLADALAGFRVMYLASVPGA